MMESEIQQSQWQNNCNDCENKIQALSNDLDRLFEDRRLLEERLSRMESNSNILHGKIVGMEKEREQNNKNKAEEIILRKTVKNYERTIKTQNEQMTRFINKVIDKPEKSDTINYVKAIKKIPQKTYILDSDLNLENEETLNTFLDSAKFSNSQYKPIKNTKIVPKSFII